MLCVNAVYGIILQLRILATAAQTKNKTSLNLYVLPFEYWILLFDGG